MELTQGQISEIISNYTSSSEGFVTLQSLIMNSLMAHERELFVKANKNEQCNGFRPRRWYCKGYTFVLRIPRSRSGNALQGIENAVCSAFPQAAHQFCVAHVKRQILNSVSHKDKPIVNQELNEVFTLENKSLQGYEHFITFVNRWEKKYPVLRKYKAQRNIAYFTYMDFPVEVQRCIYTTNWIERLNRKYKRTIKMRAAMPSSQSVLFLLASVAMEETQTTYRRKVYQWRCWKESK